MGPAAALLVLALASAASANDPIAVLETAGGERTTLRLADLDVAGPGTLSAAFVRFEGLPAPAAAGPGSAEIRLIGGDRLEGGIAGGAGEDLHVELVGAVRLALPIEAIASVVVAERLPEGADVEVGPAREGDVLFRRVGDRLDRIEGAVESFGPDGVRFDAAVGARVYDWPEVAALFVEALGEGPRSDPGEGGAVVVDLTDGSRLRGACRRLSPQGVELTLFFGAEVSLPLEAVAEVAVDDDSIRFLSELPPSRVEEGSPFGDELGMTWPHRVDRCVTGGPLRAGGRRHTRGLGVHAPSLLAWELDGRWSSLRGRCALDDEVRELGGSVEFRVLLDGRVAWSSGVRRGGDPVVELPALDLSGARELALEVLPAEDLFVFDRADWLRLLLVR